MTVYVYDWYDFSLSFGEHTFSIRSAEKFSTQDKARGRSPLPFGSSLWPAALVLSEAIVTGLPPAADPMSEAISVSFAGKRVLELGCGLGLCALAAEKMGASRVVATDGHPDMTELFEENKRRNHSHIEYAHYDWKDEKTPGVFDVVMAADVLYEPAACNLLAQAFERTLGTGVGLVCDPGRPHAGRFVDKMRNRGFSVEERRLSVPDRFFSQLKRVLDLHPTSGRVHRIYVIKKVA